MFTIVSHSIFGLSQALIMLPDLSKALMSQKTLLKVFKRIPAIPFSGGKQMGEDVGKIEFKNVKFIYPSRPNVTVLKDFSLDVKVGQSIALVGPSGSGKSTIASLLTRFYDPQEGEIFIDGTNIKEIDPKWLHRYGKYFRGNYHIANHVFLHNNSRYCDSRTCPICMHH